MKNKKRLQVMRPKISTNYIVKSYKYGQNLEITTANGTLGNGIRVLPNKQYMILRTGEVRDMNTSAKNRQENIDSVKITMRNLRRLIACNFDGGKNQLWITLTFAEHVTSTVEAYETFDRFMKRLKRQYQNLLYIAVIEPQASGRWHFHLLLKDTVGNRLYISNDKLRQIWSKGFVKVNRLKSGDNIANYVMAYVTDLEYEVTNNETNKTDKKIEKGARLSLYPKGIRIYRTSRNVERPIEITATKGELLEFYEVAQLPNYVKESTHKIDTDKEVTYITEYYNNL